MGRKRKYLSIKLFPKYLDTEKANPKDYLKVEVINEKSEYITGSLGIEESRAITLGKLVSRHFYETESITECMAKVSEECVHVNEIFFAVMQLYLLQDRNSNPLASILGSMRGPRE